MMGHHSKEVQVKVGYIDGSSPINRINDSLVIPQWIGRSKVMVCQCCLFRCCDDQKIMEDTSNNKNSFTYANIPYVKYIRFSDFECQVFRSPLY